MGVRVIKTIDRSLGSLLCRFFGLFVRKGDPERKEKVLFIQLWSVGESILTLPAMKSLMQALPESRFAVLCTRQNAEVFRASGLPLEIIVENGLVPTILKHWRSFDLAVDLEEFLNISALFSFFLAKGRVGFSGGARSRLYHKSVPYNDRQHVTLTFLDLMKVISPACLKQPLPHLLTSLEDRRHAESFLEKGKRNILLVPGAGDSAKSRIWPGFRELAGKLREARIIIVGSAGERKELEQLCASIRHPSLANTAGLLSLPQLFSLVEKADLVVSNDTGPVHIASAQNTPCVALFGPNTPVRFGPLAKGSCAVYRKDACPYSPCINVHKGKVPDCLYPKRGQDYQKCMKAISVDVVLEEITKTEEGKGEVR